MGAEMYAGDVELCFSRSCWMVAHWVEKYYTPPRSIHPLDDLGIFNYPADAVILANQNIPPEYDLSVIPKDQLEKDGDVGTRETFEDARTFLAHAADNSLDISGSY